MSDAAFGGQVAELRRFNRFYTQKIGLLEAGLLDSRFSLTEARVLYELAQTEGQTASRLARELGIDRGYLSRILRRFEERELVCRTVSPSDRRRSALALTAQGRTEFAQLDQRSQVSIGALLEGVPVVERPRLVAAAQMIERALGHRCDTDTHYRLRPHRSGDMGWIVSRHGALYTEEYGWDSGFEALVAEIAAKFLKSFNPRREACWIAENEWENLGSVMLAEQSETTAKLRLLLVEPCARGLGIGARLVAECLSFARAAGYCKVTLWTNSVLFAARHIYRKAGFHLVEAQPHHSFGQDLIGENWELVL
jgi:DNA-binding MarR family transcriptional regulator/N-acetylglutamate synthase-like GNAT family acetyltransferase